jgi:hypothetical protein
MRLVAAVVSCALCVAGTVGGAWLSRPAKADYGPILAQARDIYAVNGADGQPTRLYVVGDQEVSASSAASISRIPASAATLPWKVSVTYSLDGPNADAATVAGASGLVGVYVSVTPLTDEANRSVPLVAFTVPTQVAGDISVDDQVTVSTQGADSVVAAVGHAATGLEFSCYMNAKDFSMSAVALAVLPSDDGTADQPAGGQAPSKGGQSSTGQSSTGQSSTGQSSGRQSPSVGGQSQTGTGAAPGSTDSSDATDAADQSESTDLSGSANPSGSTDSSDVADQSGSTAPSANPSDVTDAAQLASNAATLVDSLTDAASGEHQQLIDQLTTLRDKERALGKSVVAEREAAHQQAFEAYMAAYVGSYTSHLSGSIGSSTQLPALMGTAGELSGSTPLAQAVLSLADAVNNVSAAYQHAGAVDALDEVIRRIQQQGTTGLMDDLTREVAEESTKGSKQYSDGQSQLSAAMIPYSMTYTDVYTAQLSSLTGGSSAGATAYEQKAIGQTNASPDLADANSKVDAAMNTLAVACEHTGKASALQQIVLRFSNQFEGGGSSNDNTSDAHAADSSGSAGSVGSADSGSAHSAPIDGVRALTGVADPQSQSFYGKTKALQARRKADAERRKAAQARRQSQGNDASLVDDRMSMAAGDVMSYADGLTSSLGGGAKSGDAKSDGAKSDGAKSDDAKSEDSAADSAVDSDPAPELFGFSDTTTLLKHDMSMLIGETVALGDAGTLLTQVLAQSSAASTRQTTTETRYLIVIPTV